MSFVLGGWVLNQRPKLAVYIAMIMAKAAEIEFLFAQLLVTILGAKADHATISMYLDLVGPAPRKAALFGVAEHVLTDQELKELEKLWKKVREKRGDRNNFAHGLWATTLQEPEALIFIDPKVAVRHRINERLLRDELKALEKKGAAIAEQHAIFLKLLHWSPSDMGGTVYYEDDFRAIAADLDDDQKKVIAFSQTIYQRLSQAQPPQ
jgi:hypothetical protein